MRPSDRTGLAISLSVLLATFTLLPLTRDHSFLGVSWLLIVLLGGIAVLLRRARFGAGVVVAGQLVALGVFLILFSMALPVSGVGWWQNIAGFYLDAAHHMQTQAAPMAPQAGVKFLFVSAIGIIAVMTDVLAAGIRRPAWAIAPPATLFLIPAIGLEVDTPVRSLLCIAVGYLGILIAEGLNSTGRWSVSLSHDTDQGLGTAQPVVWRAATLIGVPALAGALLFGAVIPTLSLNGWGFGSGSNVHGPLELTDPTIDMRRNLKQPEDRTVVEYQTDRPGGTYLRMASLPIFNSHGWQLAGANLEQGPQLGDIPGVDNEPSLVRTTHIKIDNFSSQYLPLPYAPRKFEARGKWGYVPQSLVVMATGRDHKQATRYLDYTVQSVDIEPDGKELADAPAGNPADAARTAIVPADLPDSLTKLTEKVTKGADTPALKAARIQHYLRSPVFTYSTEPLPGSGYQALENFLLHDRRGYCEQFAASMAMMARVSGIPSRVAVGFLPGKKKGDTWQVSIRQMHSWPELYFAGAGWVRFEPTPAVQTGAPPAWTVPRSDSDARDPQTEPSISASTKTQKPSPTARATPTGPVTSTAGDTGFPLAQTLLGSGIGLLALLALALPGTVRLRRRRSRLAPEGVPATRVESAWAEIRDTTIDLGLRWPQGSPRTIGREVSDRLLAETALLMAEVAVLVERSRYSRAFADEAAVADVGRRAEKIRHGLLEPEPWSRRVRAALLPRSLWQAAIFRLRRAPAADELIR